MPAEFVRHFEGLRRVFSFGGAKVRLLTHRRSLHYLGLLLVMLPLSLLLPHSGLSGGVELGAVAETLAANLAMLAGLAALLHYGGTQRPLHAFVGSGLLGAAVLDGLHAFAAWGLLAGAQPVADAAASGSRWFLPLWLWAGVWASSSEQPMARLVREARAAIWLAAAGLVLLCLLGARVVPTAGAAAVLLGHAASAALFFGAVEAMLRRRHWPHDIFEHCLMLALILGFVANTLFLGGARGIYDPLFAAALHLKNLSYLFVLAGLAIGMRQLLRQAEGQALALTHANESLQREIGEHSRVRQQYQDLSHSLEQRVEARTRELAQAELTAQDAKKKAEQAQQLEQQTNRQLRAQMEERMAVEKELRESENRLQLALAAGQVGIWTWDIQTGSKTWDDRVYLFMGETPGKYSPAELGGLSRVHPEDAQELEQAVRRTLEQGVDLDVAGRVVWRDGSVRHVVSRGAALRDAQGNITGIVGTLADATEHTRREQELLRQGEQLEERVRALRCLYEVAHAVAEPDLALEGIYQRVIELLPQSCRDSGATLARLVVADRQYHSAAWNDAEVQHRAEIVANGSPAGRIEIGFTNGAGRPESRAQIIQVVDVAVASLGRAMEHRRADDRLRRSEQRYRGLFDHMISHWALNEVLVDETGKPVDARFLEVNPAFEQFVGLSAAEILTKTLREIFWDLEPHEFARYGEVALSGEPARFECYSRSFDRHLEVAVFSPERGRFAVVFNDISKRKHAEETLRESRRRMHTLLGNLPGMAYRCTNDPDWTMEFVSKGCEAVTGLKPAELAARGFVQLIDPEDRDAVRNKVQQAIEEHRPFQMEYRIRTADGRSKWVWERGAAIFAENGEVEALEGFISDITERKHAEQELDNKARDLAASNAELEHFAYAASHDLQEPLRMIAGYTQLLARRYRGKLDNDADQFLQYTIEGTERLQALIRDLLSYSRVGRGDADHEPVDLEECAQASLANLQAAIGENGAQVELEPLPVVRGRRSQLIQLFQNLIGNAVKYRRDDPPLVRVSAERRGDEWLFAVRDNGIGIGPEYRDQVFELFRRLHGRSQYSGTGIGLAICKKIVESHGGRIWVGSEAGPGTTFEFTLPAELST
jgi:PAS domain S-box-containing protein